MTHKRQAVMRAARSVFGRVGYLGASIDMIAAEAGVSTRTIYNHFENKEHLFATVLTESSHQVAAAYEAIIQRHLGEITDLEADLIAFGRQWLRPLPEFADHFAIVRRINAEAERFPRELHEAWQEAGPLRVQHALAAQLGRLNDRGLLRIEDAECAAQHFAALITARVTSRTQLGAVPLEDAEIEKIATASVHAFLYGYLSRETPPTRET
ncbi:TetR/AcrR family transcriptional regulator [Candidatus Protofrankia californiensis]|uniref:TetR/AcrR family transcriptional regulator n=1 Tax=Candidatus Protofrankia californiensis TaxID=1839754 RepID=UPI0019D066E9|nr:TetR/AcrR family transcriptional regulator [Candidatus Protofrankia californiensis]